MDVDMVSNPSGPTVANHLKVCVHIYYILLGLIRGGIKGLGPWAGQNLGGPYTGAKFCKVQYNLGKTGAAHSPKMGYGGRIVESKSTCGCPSTWICFVTCICSYNRLFL